MLKYCSIMILTLSVLYHSRLLRLVPLFLTLAVWSFASLRVPVIRRRRLLQSICLEHFLPCSSFIGQTHNGVYRHRPEVIKQCLPIERGMPFTNLSMNQVTPRINTAKLRIIPKVTLTFA